MERIYVLDSGEHSFRFRVAFADRKLDRDSIVYLSYLFEAGQAYRVTYEVDISGVRYLIIVPED